MNKHISPEELRASAASAEEDLEINSDEAIERDWRIAEAIARRRLVIAKINIGIESRPGFATGDLWKEYRAAGDHLEELRPASTGGANAMLDEIQHVIRMNGGDEVAQVQDAAIAIGSISFATERRESDVAADLAACVEALTSLDRVALEALGNDPEEYHLARQLVRIVSRFVTERLAPAAGCGVEEQGDDFLSVLRATKIAWHRFNNNGSTVEDVDDPDWQAAQRLQEKLETLRPKTGEEAAAGLRELLAMIRDGDDLPGTEGKFAESVIGATVGLLSAKKKVA